MMRTLSLMAVAATAFAADSSLARGFGEKYSWFSLTDGLVEAKESGKPIMLVQHKSWCGMCKRFGPEFGNSEAILKKAEEFVLVNCMDDDIGCESSEYKPDGGYIPRILFLSSEGKVNNDIKTPGGNPKYQYFYSSPDQVVRGMDEALSAFKGNDEL